MRVFKLLNSTDFQTLSHKFSVYLISGQEHYVRLKLTVLSDGCWRRLQHVLRKVNEDLVELSSPQQVEVFNNLSQD